MSTEDLKKTVVTLKKGVDVDAFMQEMNSVGNTTSHIPNRAVEIFNERPESLRNVDFIMTRQEADNLRNDPRVLGVRYGTKKENGIEVTPFAIDTLKPYPRTNTFTASGNVDMNWGFPQTNSTTNQYATVNTVNYAQPYTLTGEGVDFVVQDTGLQINHPEFQNEFGVSRVNAINWYTAAGLTGSLPTNFYTDVDGHGTHVASTTSGKHYGFAKNSQIYCMNILGYANNGDIPIGLSYNLIRLWHQNKPITNTGYKRPTIINMSWGYSAPISSVTGGIWRGIPFTTPGVLVPSKGLVTSRVPYIEVSVEADLEDCLDAGVIMISAAGNSSYKIDVPGGLDWDNSVNFSFGGSTYYMRASTPSSNPRVLRVGAIALNQTGGEKKASFSCTGPGVQIYAAGDYIVGATSNVNTFVGSYPVANYPYNPAFRSAKVSGTSMASPLVAGIVCTLLESRPWYDQGRIINFITDNASKNRLQNPANSYTDFTSLQGGPNNYLYNPFSGNIITQIIDADATLYGKF